MARDAEPRMSHAARGSEMDNPSSELAPCEGPDLRPICIASAGDGIDHKIASVAPALTRYPASAASSVSSGPGLNLPSLLLTSCPRIPPRSTATPRDGGDCRYRSRISTHSQASTERSSGSPADEQLPVHRETHPEDQFSGSEDIVRRKNGIVRLARTHRSRGRFVRRTG